uniref:Uncharacterized protein n=1 Tax=viral metagenome TaxID=1070528 RepID=A0A6M3LBF3_9ZZZZ
MIVCVSVAIGATIQLVPSQMASNIPPILSLAVTNPMLLAAASLNVTIWPSVATSTTMS